jgi:chemotaxis protein MotB
VADENNNTTIIIKKIKKAGHGHHGGAWKVAYADFVTAMMAFFLVMWIVAMSQPMKEGIQRYFEDPLKHLFGSEQVFQGLFEAQNGKEMMSTPKTGGVADTTKTGGLAKLHLLATELKEDMKLFTPEVFGFRVHPDRIQFAITAQALFSPGGVLLKPEAQPLLDRISKLLKPLNANVMVEAHTDDLPADAPNVESNWELSALRAATVVRYFIEGHYFDPSKMTAMAASEFRPVADNRTPEGRAKNRRVDIYVIPDKENKFGYRSPASEGEPVGEDD